MLPIDVLLVFGREVAAVVALWRRVAALLLPAPGAAGAAVGEGGALLGQLVEPDAEMAACAHGLVPHMGRGLEPAELGHEMLEDLAVGDQRRPDVAEVGELDERAGGVGRVDTEVDHELIECIADNRADLSIIKIKHASTSWPG
jgi:hypothetical protein